MKRRFVDKGYSSIAIEEEIEKISAMDRSILTAEKTRVAQDNKFKHSFFTTFLKKHYSETLGDFEKLSSVGTSSSCGSRCDLQRGHASKKSNRTQYSRPPSKNLFFPSLQGILSL